MFWFRTALKELLKNKGFSFFFIINLSIGLTGFIAVLSFSRALTRQMDTHLKEIFSADIEISSKHILKIKQKLNKILAKHTGQTVIKIEKDSDRDYYMSAEEAENYGLIDKIIEKR